MAGVGERGRDGDEALAMPTYAPYGGHDLKKIETWVYYGGKLMVNKLVDKKKRYGRDTAHAVGRTVDSSGYFCGERRVRVVDILVAIVDGRTGCRGVDIEAVDFETDFGGKIKKAEGLYFSCC